MRFESTSFQPVQWPLAGSAQRVGARLASPYVILFVILIIAFGYTPPRWQDWNQNSRFNLTRAIVERQTVQIDAYAGNTGDYALFNGHVYTDKAPGLSFLAAPVYTATKAVEPVGLDALSQRIGRSGGFQATLNPDGEGVDDDRISTAVALYIAAFLVVSIPAAIMIVLLALIVRRLTGSDRVAIASGLIVGLATPVFTYSQAFYGHVPAAACLVGALAILVLRPQERIRTGSLLAIGALLGWAIVIELPAALVALPIAIWTLWRFQKRALVWLALGSLPGFVLLAAYDFAAFQTPMPVGYRYSALWQEQHSTGFLSFTYPQLDGLWGLSFSTFRGLFVFSPILILAIPGFLLALRHRKNLSVTLVAVSGFTLMFLMMSSSVMWWGGFAVGPRYIVPAIPLLAIPLGYMLLWIDHGPRHWRYGGWAVVVLLTLISIVVVWSTTFAGQNYPPDSIRRTLIDYVLPTLQEGDVARNLGMALQLDGLLSLLPIIAITAAGAFLIGRQLKSAEGSQP